MVAVNPEMTIELYLSLIVAFIGLFLGTNKVTHYLSRKLVQKSSHPHIVKRQIGFFWFYGLMLFLIASPLLFLAHEWVGFIVMAFLLLFAGGSFVFLVLQVGYENIKPYSSPLKWEVHDKIKLFHDPPIELSFSELNKHVHVLAPSGSGKTKSVLAPLVIQVIEKGIGTLVIDPKGDNEVVSAFLKRMRDLGRLEDFWYFDPVKPSVSMSWNPFYSAIKQGNYKDIAQKVIATMPKGGGTATFYEKLQSEFARAITVLLSILPYTNKMVNFLDLYAIIGYLPRSIEYLLEQYDIKGGVKDQIAELWLKTIMQEARQNKDYKQYLRNLQQHLALYAFTFFPELLNAYEPDIKISEGFKEGKFMYFALRALDFPAGESVDIGKMVFLDLINHAAMKYNKGIALDVPDLVFVDEAPQVFVPEAEKLFDMARGAGIGVVLFHQSIFQFEKIQKGLFQNIFSNCNVKLLLGAGDDETAKFYSNFLGEELRRFSTYSRGGKSFIINLMDIFFPQWGELAQEKYDYRVRPEELKTMKPGEAILIKPGIYGQKGRLYYFADEGSLLKPEQILPKRRKVSYMDESKGLCLLKVFKQNFGQEENLQDTVRVVQRARQAYMPVEEEVPSYTDSLTEVEDISGLFNLDNVQDTTIPGISSQ